MTEILEQLQINNSFFVEFILFMVFFFVFSAVYLKPIQKLITARRQKLGDDILSSSELLRTVESRLNEYEKQLSHARHEALTNYESVLHEVQAQEDLKMNAVKEELKKEFLKNTQQLQSEKQKIEAELQTQVAQLASAISEKALGGK